MKAGQLAQLLAEHPDADVRLMVPQLWRVRGAMYFPADDESASPDMFLLAVGEGLGNGH